nr:tumor necrosis factor receptor superfamily member 19L isoform X3 [Anser cygnoides]
MRWWLVAVLGVLSGPGTGTAGCGAPRCPPGEEPVGACGSAQTCRPCPPGAFSPGDAPCAPHTRCHAANRLLLAPGTAAADSRCGGCVHGPAASPERGSGTAGASGEQRDTGGSAGGGGGGAVGRAGHRAHLLRHGLAGHPRLQPAEEEGLPLHRSQGDRPRGRHRSQLRLPDRGRQRGHHRGPGAPDHREERKCRGAGGAAEGASQRAAGGTGLQTCL